MIQPSFGNLLKNLAAPFMCVGLLGGMVFQQANYLDAEDFEPFHAQIRQMVDDFPLAIAPKWLGEPTKVPQSALVILRPNAIRSIEYWDTTPDSPVRVSMVIVQCKFSGDMVGHYPPNCYSGIGYAPADTGQAVTARDWEIDGVTIPGTEYHFVRQAAGQRQDKIVYNFMVVPERGIFRDIQAVQSAAEDYQQRYYGAAQFQLVFDGLTATQLSRYERDELFVTLFRQALPLIEKLKSGANL
ncbi:MAG: hypothetical protein ACFCVE_02575 [Phycisphaerae bacterium]